MSQHPDLDAMAREVLDANVFMALATIEDDGTPRVSPVYFTPVGYREYYWVSSPDSTHSHNVTARPDVSMVVFDSSVTPRETSAVYVTAQAHEVPADELEQRCQVAFRAERGARAFTPAELSGDGDLRMYVATASRHDVHVRGSHPVHGTGIDRRVPAEPADR